MKSKPKTKRTLLAALALTLLLMLSACSAYSYGDTHNTLANLQEYLLQEGHAFLYPDCTAFPLKSYRFVHTTAPDTGDILGYRIYIFGSPYYACVYAYVGEADAVKSEKMSQITVRDPLISALGEITLYEGKLHEDTLYFIGAINIDGTHYEVRVTADEVMKDGKYVNAIFADNANYAAAKAYLVSIVEGLQ